MPGAARIVGLTLDGYSCFLRFDSIGLYSQPVKYSWCIFYHFSYLSLKLTNDVIMSHYTHGGSMKSKPNGFCHIYRLPDHIKIKFPRCLESLTKNMIPTYRNISFNS